MSHWVDLCVASLIVGLRVEEGPSGSKVCFQYRANRQINSELVETTAGFVVEHDTRSAWSGVVFRPLEDLVGEEGASGASGSSGSRHGSGPLGQPARRAPGAPG